MRKLSDNTIAGRRQTSRFLGVYGVEQHNSPSKACAESNCKILYEPRKLKNFLFYLGAEGMKRFSNKAQIDSDGKSHRSNINANPSGVFPGVILFRSGRKQSQSKFEIPKEHKSTKHRNLNRKKAKSIKAVAWNKHGMHDNHIPHYHTLVTNTYNLIGVAMIKICPRRLNG